MPVFEVALADGRTFEVEADQPPTEADVLSALEAQPAAPAVPQEQSSGGASATLGAARAVPAGIRSVGRFAANHPAATQKVIGAGISTMAGGAGAAVGGVPGAVVGASIRGVTPAQSVIREAAGKMAGEAPAVARNAGRAVAVANYATEAGLPLKPAQLVSTGAPARAVDKYAESMGQRVPRILDQYGKVVVGPEAPPVPTKPGMLRTGAGKAASTLSKVLGPLSAMTGATDFAQTVEPTRRDIGVMGIGRSVDVPGAHPPALEQLRQAILKRLGY